MDFRTDIINATRNYYESEIEQHRINAEIILNHPIANENQNIVELFKDEVSMIAEYEGKLIALKHYFK
jgi:hypothetical protein